MFDCILYYILSQVARSYVFATSGALITALGLNKLVKVSNFELYFISILSRLSIT